MCHDIGGAFLHVMSPCEQNCSVAVEMATRSRHSLVNSSMSSSFLASWPVSRTASSVASGAKAW